MTRCGGCRGSGGGAARQQQQALTSRRRIQWTRTRGPGPLAQKTSPPKFSTETEKCSNVSTTPTSGQGPSPVIPWPPVTNGRVRFGCALALARTIDNAARAQELAQRCNPGNFPTVDSTHWLWFRADIWTFERSEPSHVDCRPFHSQKIPIVSPFMFVKEVAQCCWFY